MLWKRVITAIVLASLAIFFIFFQPTESFMYALLVVSFIAGWEWARLSGLLQVFFKVLYAGIITALVYLVWRLLPEYPHLLEPVMLVAILWWCVVVYILVSRVPEKDTRSVSWKKIAMGIMTLVPAVIGLVHVHQQPQGAYWLFFVLSVIWVADIGAFFSGRRFGKHKLAPKLSPGKTREGLYGALLATQLYSLVAGWYFHLPLKAVIILQLITFVATLLSVAGDLFISLLKRERGIKDSGTILPGHGGVLDRIDSITSSAPLFALLLTRFVIHGT